MTRQDWRRRAANWSVCPCVKALMTTVSPHQHSEGYSNYFRIKASELEPRYGIEP